ncbi:MAG TPA: thioredoxin family protein [Geothrix sp.]|nr:thioredoxin family protein [Geothrix sp.]
MKTALCSIATLGLVAQAPQADTSHKRPLLLGESTPAAILASRASFREHFAKVGLTPRLRARWKAVKQPLTLVAVFGSWCGDSHRELPDLLALDAEPNPFIEVHYLGVDRDKALGVALWPKGCTPQRVVRVPTFYLFAAEPGGHQRLVGSVVETPPRSDESMAEALVALVESAPTHQSR